MAKAMTALRFAGAAAQVSGAHRWGAKSGFTAVLFHHVADGRTWRGDDPFVDGLGVTMQRDAFADCVRYLARSYDVVGLPELLAGSGARRRTDGGRARRRVVICFDDAYASVVDLAAPVLAELGLPWCFFVNPTLVGNTGLAADNAAAYVANTHGLDVLSRAAGRPVTSIGDFIHGHFVACTPAQRRDLMSKMLDDVGADPVRLAAEAKLYIEPADVRRLADSGVEIANHTAEHVHCRTLDAGSIGEQILESAEALRKLSGRPVRGFAYPYGNLQDRTELVTNALRTSGHECAFVVHNRANTTRTDPFGWFRVSLNTGDPRLLAAQLEVLPRLRAVKATLRAGASQARQRAKFLAPKGLS